MAVRSSNDEAARTLRHSPEIVKRALDRLDEGAIEQSSVDARRSERYRYRVHSLCVELEQSGSGWTRYAVPSRNISREGVSFLFGHFVYPGCTCRVHLVNLQNQAKVVTGRVVRCRYLEGSGTLHEIGVHFDEPIEVGMFNRGAARLRFLLVDNNPATFRLVGQMLRALDVEVAHVSTTDRVFDLIARSQFDLVLIDLESTDEGGLQLAGELRTRGYSRYIVAACAQSEEQMREQCLSAGCDHYLAKPTTHEALTAMIDALWDKPIFSSLAGDPELAELVTSFVMDLPRQVSEIERALGERDYAALGKMVRALKGEGAAYGFQAITDAAVATDELLEGDAEQKDVQARVSELVRTCLSARPIAAGPGGIPRPSG